MARRKAEGITLPDDVKMSRPERSRIEERRQMLMDLVADFQNAGHSAMAIGVVHGVALYSARGPDNVTFLGMILASVKATMIVAGKHEDKYTLGVLRGIEAILEESVSFLETKRDGEVSLQ